MRRLSSLPSTARWIVILAATWFVVACGDAPQQARVEPFSWEQVGRIDAGVRSGPAATDPTEEELPIWVSTSLRDERTRMVVHVRLDLPVDVEALAWHDTHCAQVRDRMEEYLLPGQRVELYLVFDDSVHPCPSE